MRASAKTDQLSRVLDAVSAKLTTEELVDLNDAVSGDSKTEPQAAAKQWWHDRAWTPPSRDLLLAVSKRFRDGTVAVDGLDLKIDAGSFTVFVGPSGCGKTTSMRMINRMVVPTAGTVTVDGRDVATTDVVELRRSIGYVIQGGGLLPHRTVVDNVATVPVLRGSPAVPPDARRWTCSIGGARPRAGEPLSGAAVGWPTAAGGGGAGARGGPADPPDGRAFQRGRSGGARRTAVRDAAAAGRTAQDDRVRHPRHRRGRPARRPGRGVRPARPAATVRRPGHRTVGSRNRFRRRFRRP